MTLSKGRKLGPYEVQELIGAGGMGEVYRGIDTRLGRTIAIKTIPAALASRPDYRKRFELEARAIASLHHPNICALYDLGEDEDVVYMVMEHLEGESLADRLKRGPLAITQALTSAAHLAEALEQAHRRGVVHRDLKPGNILLTPNGEKLLDFGLARLTEHRETAPGDNDPTKAITHGTNSVLGTPQYMAPEQIEGKEADARSDVFAFGCVLHEMLTGQKAFVGETTQSVMAAILRSDSPELSDRFSPSLRRALRQCLAKNPEERWQTFGDLKREILWIANDKEPAAVELRPIPRREILAWGTAAAFGATALAEWLRIGNTPHPDALATRFSITEPAGVTMNFFQTSPAIHRIRL